MIMCDEITETAKSIMTKIVTAKNVPTNLKRKGDL